MNNQLLYISFCLFCLLGCQELGAQFERIARVPDDAAVRRVVSGDEDWLQTAQIIDGSKCLDVSLAWLSKCKTLQQLELGPRRDGKSYPTAALRNIASAPTITHLDMGLCVLDDLDAVELLASAKRLVALNLAYVTDRSGGQLRVSSQLLASFTGKLESLDLSKARVDPLLVPATEGRHLALHLAKCDLSPGTFASILKSGVNELVLDGVELGESEFDLLPTCTTVECLSIGVRRTLPLNGPAKIGVMTGLKALSLAHIASMSDAALMKLTSLVKLEYLDISMMPAIDVGAGKPLPLSDEYKVTVAGCFAIAKLPSLHTLIARSTALTDGWLEAISTMKSLRALDLRWCEQWSEKGAAALAGMEGLARLVVRGGYWSGARSPVTGRILSHLAKSTTITNLDISCSANVTLEGVQALGSMSQLTSLTAIDCKWLKDDHVARLFKLRSLELLDVSGASSLSSNALQGIDNLRKLRILRLRACSNIDNGALKHLEKAEALSVLSVVGTQIDGSAIADFRKARTGVLFIED